jgi:hypothetical protein
MAGGYNHRVYKHGGILKYQSGYLRKNGTPVQPHFKTWPDNKVNNNRKFILGY